METRLSVATPDEPAGVAGNRMLRHKIGCLPVVNAAGRLAGIVTVDDFLRWATERLSPKAAPGAAVPRPVGAAVVESALSRHGSEGLSPPPALEHPIA